MDAVCAEAVRGQETEDAAALPRSVMNSRRCMRCLRKAHCAMRGAYHFATRRQVGNLSLFHIQNCLDLQDTGDGVLATFV